MAKKRKSGAGTLRQRSDGRWEGRIVIDYDDAGKPRTKSVFAKSKTECAVKLKALKAECETMSGKLPQRAKPEMPFGDWLKLWYEAFSKPALRPTTQDGYENRIYQHIIPGIGKIPLNKLTQNDLQLFYAELKASGRVSHVDLYGEGLSDRMVRSCHATCRSALERAKREGLSHTNPAVGCKLPPKKAKEMQVLTEDEMRHFLLQAREEGCYEMVMLELATGLRRGEFCALQWDDLNLATGELHICRQVYRIKGELQVSEPKTKSSIRTVILPPSVLELLKVYRQTVQESRWIFPSPVKPDSPWDPTAMRKKFQRVMKHAGCKVVRFHDLRHTFATTALSHGMDVKTLSAYIGHVSAATTLDIYSHVTDAMQLQAATKIEAGIGTGEAYEPRETPLAKVENLTAQEMKRPKFEPYKGKIRRSGTGGIYELNDHLFEGRYSPTNAQGKREVHTVYAHTREECETKLAEMIERVREKIKKGTSNFASQ